jgi:hypothetical protein
LLCQQTLSRVKRRKKENVIPELAGTNNLDTVAALRP